MLSGGRGTALILLDKNELDHAILMAHRLDSTAARLKTARIGERTMTVARILDQKGRDVFTTQPHRTLKEVVELLAAKGVGAVGVSDASLQVLGIVSDRDVVRVIARHGASALD